MSYAMVRATRLDLDTFAAAVGLHPEMIRRLVPGHPRRRPVTPRVACGSLRRQLGSVVARIQRLRAGFGLNYAAVGLVLDLLDRISALEAALRRPRRPGG